MSPNSFGVLLSTGPSAPNIWGNIFSYSLPPGKFLPHHLTCWEPVLFLKASREDAFSKRWDDKALPCAAFPVELISQVSDLHGIYLALLSPAGLNYYRKELGAQLTFGGLFLFHFFFFSNREIPSSSLVKFITRILATIPRSLRALHHHFPSPSSYSLLSRNDPGSLKPKSHWLLSITYGIKSILWLSHQTLSVSPWQIWKMSSLVLLFCRSKSQMRSRLV